MGLGGPGCIIGLLLDWVGPQLLIPMGLGGPASIIGLLLDWVGLQKRCHQTCLGRFLAWPDFLLTSWSSMMTRSNPDLYP
jgi:hypothetical protein